MNDAQIASHILMIRPARFGFNPETAASNAFQNEHAGLSAGEISQRGLAEFDEAVKTLRGAGVDIIVFEDTPHPVKTDAVFPNNWISFHADGRVVTYPMFSPSRRLEIRQDIIDELAKTFEVTSIWRLDERAEHGRFLEGTGSMVLDRDNRICYACKSPRTDPELVQEFCQKLSLQPILFDACDSGGLPVYHTNVIMAMTQRLVVICLESIGDPRQRDTICSAITASGKQLMEISLNQVAGFCGNLLQIARHKKSPVVALSTTAHTTYTPQQLAVLNAESELVVLDIPVIENCGGGSVRCMLTEIFLPEKK